MFQSNWWIFLKFTKDFSKLQISIFKWKKYQNHCLSIKISVQIPLATSVKEMIKSKARRKHFCLCKLILVNPRIQEFPPQVSSSRDSLSCFFLHLTSSIWSFDIKFSHENKWISRRFGLENSELDKFKFWGMRMPTVRWFIKKRSWRKLPTNGFYINIYFQKFKNENIDVMIFS